MPTNHTDSAVTTPSAGADDNKAADAPASAPAAIPPPRKSYTKPTIARHGNLRMMTQLE